MSIPLTDVVYPLDTSGLSPSNRIPNERHELTTTTWDGFNLIIPKAAPFFDDSIEFLIHYPSGRRLDRGRDWITGWRFESATGEIGQFISSCIYIFDTAMVGHVEIPSYQCLGGEWQIDLQTLQAILAEKLLNPQRYYWEYVANLPQIFRPLDHDQDIDEFSELGQLLDELRAISQAIISTSEAGAIGEHEAKRNPHKTRPVDLEGGGLGNLMNWLVASVQEMQLPNNLPLERYMTPPATLQLINSSVGAQLATFMARRDNPNGVTAEQAGATTEQQVRDLIDGYLSGSIGSGVNAATLNGYSSQQITDNVLAAAGETIQQRGDEVLDELRQEMAGFQATDTVRFDGKTAGEWEIRINDLAWNIINEESLLQMIPTLEDVLTLAAEPQEPGGEIIEFNTATLTERVKVVVAEYFPKTNWMAENGCALIVNIDGLVFHVLPSNGPGDNGVVYATGDAAKAAQYTWFTDEGGADGRNRLWVETPPDREAMSVLTLDTVGTIVQQGYVYYGPSSATQFTHPALKTLAMNITATRAWASGEASRLIGLNNDATVKADLHVVTATVDIPANDDVEYNLETLLNQAGILASYDTTKAVVYVRIENKTAGSPNLNSWINAENVCSYGMRADLKTAFVYNHTGSVVKAFVRVSVPKK